MFMYWLVVDLKERSSSARAELGMNDFIINFVGEIKKTKWFIYYQMADLT